MSGGKIRGRYKSGRIGAAFLILRTAKRALRILGAPKKCRVEITVTDDAGIRPINLEYRGIDAATDVLSFPQYELELGEFPESDSPDGVIFLGDIVLSLERARLQALEIGHSTEREVMYLTVHSVLHLLGYDHEDEGEDKLQMRAKEKEVMAWLSDDA